MEELLRICKDCGKEFTPLIVSKNSCIDCEKINRKKREVAYVAKRFQLSGDEYKELTKKCWVCGYDIIVLLHHKDRNKENNNKENFVCLCYNCHKLVHSIHIPVPNEIREKIETLRKVSFGIVPLSNDESKITS